MGGNTIFCSGAPGQDWILVEMTPLGPEFTLQGSFRSRKEVHQLMDGLLEADDLIGGGPDA
jgi:hypothetical protein